MEIFALICLLFLALPAHSLSEEDEPSGIDNTTLVLLSVVVSIVSVSTLVFCTWTWIRRQYRKCCPLAPPPEDPEAIYGDGLDPPFPRQTWGSMSELNVNNLGSDHGYGDYNNSPLIEPLPGIQDLASATVRYYVSESGDARLSFDSLQLELNTRFILKTSEPDHLPNTADWFPDTARSFPRAKVTFMDEVGAGWFGFVVTAEAMDIIPFPRRCKTIVKYLSADATDAESMQFLEENRVYRDANHRNILKLLGHCLETMPYMLIFEEHSKGNFKEFLLAASKGVGLLDSRGANSRSKMAIDVANGLQWMHDNGFIHPDLATRNCLVGGDGQIVIGDYGLGTRKFKEDFYWCGTNAVPIRWMAPESLEITATVITTCKKTKASNIWSFGVLLWEICELGKLPYYELTDDEVMSRVISDKNYNLRAPSITMLPYVTLRAKMADILTSCFNPIPSQRPDVAEVRKRLEIPQ